MSGRSHLRAANAVISAAMLALFLVHGVGNAFQLLGVGSPLSRGLAHTTLALCAAHAAIGCALTYDTFRARARGGAPHAGQNRRFWAARASGLALAALIAAHMLIFTQPSRDPVRLNPFGPAQLALSLALVICLAIHILTNLQPLMISLGIPAPSSRAADVAIVSCLLLALMALAFAFYFLRWAAP